MPTEISKEVARAARQIYSNQRENLERDHLGEYVCIEPNSGSLFFGESFDEAVNSAIDAFPDRLTHTLRIGHVAAFHLGVLTR